MDTENNVRRFIEAVESEPERDADRAGAGDPPAPNTFHYKSHPNAKTKDLGSPVRTSTVNKAPDPDWMPPELHDRWDDDWSQSVRITRDLGLDSGNSVVQHDSQAQTPMWKRVQQDYHQNRQPPLKHIFDDRSAGSSTASTPYGTMEKLQFTKDQISEIAGLLEQQKDKPDDYPITLKETGSPLKLFGPQYNTFTKGVLSDIIKKMRPAPAFETPIVEKSPEAEPEIESAADKSQPVEQVSVSQPVEDDRFMKKANNIFDHIQKRGFVTKPSGTLPSLNTATSTPKAKPDDHEFSSFTSGFNEESTQFPHRQNSDDYTSVSESSNENLSDLRRQMSTDRPSSYTFEEFSSNRSSNGSGNVSKADLEDKIKHLESKLDSLTTHHRDVEALVDENRKLRHELDKNVDKQDIDDYDLTYDQSKSFQDFIQWKRASQLQLEEKAPFTTLKPDSHLPVRYDNMVLDETNQRWVSNDNKENAYKGSLDSIEDLVSNDGKTAIRENSILKSSPVGRRHRQEVSFHIPHSNEGKKSVLKSSPSNDNNVTRVSQIDELSFTQSQRKMVSIITDALMADIHSPSNWNKVTDASLVDEDLSNVKDLDSFLPNLTRLDLSKNHIRFLEGIPKTISELNLSGNDIENTVSFNMLYDVSRLNVSENSLTNLNCISENIHISDLNVGKNQIGSVRGLQRLVNLTRLDLSQNNLQGEVSFTNLHLSNLQELNLSDNTIASVTGLEQLPNLRVLNLNENELTNLSCDVAHSHLKKLLVKGNQLRSLELHNFPFLRVLRFDGNRLHVVSGLKKLRHLDEVSCKSLMNNDIAKLVLKECPDVQTLDISGNAGAFDFSSLPHGGFYNVNKLVLSAMDLSRLPDGFADMFPNVRELNLNFNRLDNISALSKLANLRKLYLVSNKISKVEMVVTSLLRSRSTLKAIDLRLNKVNLDFYPYVFNPHELEFASKDTSPIQLETLEDIESFAIHFQSLSKTSSDWERRDTEFLRKLREKHKIKKRLNYEALLVNFFNNLKKIDGSIVTSDKRSECETWLKSKEMTDVL